MTEVYALIDISNQMLEDSAFDMEGEIRGRGAIDLCASRPLPRRRR
ncbi:hypothetical protein [Pararhizobium sp. A13]